MFRLKAQDAARKPIGDDLDGSEPLFAEIVDSRAEVAEHVDELADRSLPHARDAVERVAPPLQPQLVRNQNVRLDKMPALLFRAVKFGIELEKELEAAAKPKKEAGPAALRRNALPDVYPETKPRE